MATSCLPGVSTRRVGKLAGTLGIQSLSKSQVSELAKSLDGAMEQFRSRPPRHPRQDRHLIAGSS